MAKKIILILTILCFLPNIACTESDQVSVLRVSGKAEYYDSEKNVWSELKEGLKLTEDDAIKTGADSSCDLQLGEHLFRLKENTTIKLEDLDVEESINIKLLSGELMNKLQQLPPESIFTVETPEAVVGVRGTIFSAFRKDKKGTEVYVAEKNVNVESTDMEEKSVICGENEKVNVSPWSWAAYEALGKAGIKPKTKKEKEISEEAYISRFGAQNRIDTYRVAQLDGYRNLAEKIYGTVIKRNATLKDYSKDADIVIKKVDGIVRGAEIVDTRFYSNGMIKIRMIIKGNTVVDELKPSLGDVFGANYLSSPEVVEIEDFDKYIELENL